MITQNKKAEGEANMENIGKYILAAIIIVIATIGTYMVIKKLTTGF